MPETDILHVIADWVRQQSSILVLSHERPDGDAYGSVIGLTTILREAGIDCNGYLPHPLPTRYSLLENDLEHIAVGGTLDIHAYQSIICLDTTDQERLALPAEPSCLNSVGNVCNIDHHGDNKCFGSPRWVDPAMASTTQMLSVLARKEFQISARGATAFLTGLVTDTGSFRFSNATPDALREAAALTEAGADYGQIIDNLFFRESYARRCLEAHLLMNAVFAHGRRLVYAVLDPQLLAKLGVEQADTEGIIDGLRCIDGVDIACLMQPESNRVRFSLRARNTATPVNTIARRIGGGGHPLAAGAKKENISIEEAEKLLIDETKDVLG